MKKVVLVFLAIVLLTGCTNINSANISSIINDGITTDKKLSNQYRTGYKYYLPRGLNVVSQSDYNERFNSDLYTYYLYVDVVSYYYDVQKDYKINDDAYYSAKINHDQKFGYIEINQTDDKYLVEIMYNYAKIEVIVNHRDINSTVASAITILNSIQYNKNIIENVMGDNALQFKETELNIFDTKETEGNYINYEEMYGQYEEETTHDSDLIE